jgi:streptomycin 3"-adenylyltransferase
VESEQFASEARRAAIIVGRPLEAALGADLVAVYLHGSGALGGFRWDRSDLDILVLSRDALSDAQFGGVTRALAGLDYPANGLELSVMTANEALHPSFPAPRFELHQTTDGLDRTGIVVDGRTRGGDPDLILHLAVCRARGVAIWGPPPSLSIASVPDEVVLTAMRGEVQWARELASLEYLVLTAARLWLFVETRRISSKVEAGEWAAPRYDDPDLIEAALARQRGADAEIPRDAAERFAGHAASLANDFGR